jgi:hypothetical protein
MTFATERLPLATYLHASGALRFSHVQPTQNSKVAFIFDDPQQIGYEAELEFDNGALVPATALFAGQRFLRRKMTENLKYGELNAYRNSH